MILTRILTLAFLVGLFACLGGCNTVSGFGEDLQILGRKMEHKAEEVYHGDSY